MRAIGVSLYSRFEEVKGGKSGGGHSVLKNRRMRFYLARDETAVHHRWSDGSNLSCFDLFAYFCVTLDVFDVRALYNEPPHPVAPRATPALESIQPTQASTRTD